MICVILQLQALPTIAMMLSYGRLAFQYFFWIKKLFIFMSCLFQSKSSLICIYIVGGYGREGAHFSPVRGSWRGLRLSCWLVGSRAHHQRLPSQGVLLIQWCRSCTQLWLPRLGLKGPLLVHCTFCDTLAIDLMLK